MRRIIIPYGEIYFDNSATLKVLIIHPITVPDGINRRTTSEPKCWQANVLRV